MAAATTTEQFKTQTQIKPKRRKRRETTITTSATDLPLLHHHHQQPTIVSPDSSWCCSVSSNSKPQPPPTKISSPPSSNFTTTAATATQTDQKPQKPRNSSPSKSTFKLNFSSPGRVSPLMDSSAASAAGGGSVSSPSYVGVVNGIGGGGGGGGNPYVSYPSSYSKFNSALNAGLLNPNSPPPDKTRSSPTLFEMMSNEQDIIHPRPNNTSNTHIQPHQNPNNHHPQYNNVPLINGKPSISIQDRQIMLQRRLEEITSMNNDSNGGVYGGIRFNDLIGSDVKLTLSSKDGLTVAMNVHRQILVANSRFFADKLSDKWSKQQRSLPHIVEISDCDDVEVYIETLRLMYSSKDLKKKLMREDVSKVLGILKVSAAIEFDAGVLSCLEYLEAVPWAEDEEVKVASILSQLRLEGSGAGEVLKRVSVEVVAGPEEVSNSEEVLLKLLQVVLEGKDEKARREMKGLVSKMLRENSSQNDLSKESLYSACDECLELLREYFLRAATSDLQYVSQISRQADNLHWILDILIDRQIAGDFLETWADQFELAEAHSKVPAIHRYEVSRVTSRLFVGIGKGQILGSKEVRCLLLRTWLDPFYSDFGWMRRAWKGLDRHLIEDGLSNTILTLPLAWQQEILLAWFNRFLNSGEDCPNIQRGFQVWWRRAFWRRNGESERPRLLRIAAAACENP
ncbi:hypothetical protein C5167_004646 [Papaver somniferum]|uniref:BTB domain-containing protein n=1 Tax=Papaver somniferum TaxID=3469 RepID=A0A4Y7JBQ9_PAPSO|nr:BTB/POZ domain-containing protein At1g63850-like [Papaver somniferum]RZC57341.1 hypothetical protein C5167_004646 [Papaver somniferum]